MHNLAVLGSLRRMKTGQKGVTVGLAAKRTLSSRDAHQCIISTRTDIQLIDGLRDLSVVLS